MRSSAKGARTGVRCGEWASKCLILDLNMVSFGAFWVVFFTVQLPVLHAKRYNLVSFPVIFVFFRFK